MQGNKRNTNGWILCPSKSFPGKLYYFNVVNGEAAWSLDDVENKSLKQDSTIHKVADKSHCFPEPDTPPLDETLTTNGTNICNQPLPKNLINIPTQVFGEPVFPKYFSSIAPVLWAPIQMLMPPAEKKITSSQVTQTFDSYSVICHSTSIPLSKRFSKPILNIENKFENRLHSNKFFDAPSPKKMNTNETNFSKYGTHHTKTSGIFKYPEMQMINYKPKPRSCSESEVKAGVSNFLFKNAKLNSTLYLPNTVNKPNQSSFTQTPSWTTVYTLTQSNTNEDPANQILAKRTLSKSDEQLNNDNQKSTLSTSDKDDNSNESEEKYNNFDSEDLRFLLLAKRRKVVCGDSTEGTKQITSRVTNATPKKKVTFNLGSLYDSEQEDNLHKHNVPKEDVRNPDINHLRSLTKPTMNKDIWYIVVDAERMLDDYDFIDKFVQSDRKCKLLIPYVVRSDIENMSKGDSCGRHRMMVARKLCRRLAMPADHIVLQPANLEDEEFVKNQILNCCFECMRVKNRHVVLITNDTMLLKTAKSLGIHSYKLQEIKDGVVYRKVTFDRSNIIDTKNDVRVNLFLQNNLKDDVNLDNVFRGIFDCQNSSINKPILDDKLINITQKNMKGTINYESDTIDSSSDIGHCIKKMNLKDNGKVNIDRSLFNDENQMENFNFTNKSGIYIDEDVQKFHVRDKMMRDKIRLRIDEWICTMSQIMEDVLSDILLQISSRYRIPPPWYLCEAVECIKVMYNQEPSVVSVINRLSLLMFNCSCEKGRLKSKMNPEDFMKILGHGIALIKSLQTITPSQELKEAREKLDALLRTIEDPSEECDVLITPVVSRSEVTEVVPTKRYIFQKNRSDTLKYLQKHYPQWKSYIEDSENCDFGDDVQMNHQDRKIVRTFGKNIGLLKIDNTKNISMIKPPKEPHSVVTNTMKITEGPKVIRTLNSMKNINNTKVKEGDATKNLRNEFKKNGVEMAVPKIMRTSQTKEDGIDDPKVFRNLENINGFSLKKSDTQSKKQNNKLNLRSVQISDFSKNDLNILTHGNTSEGREERKVSPKVIRAYEDVNRFSFKKAANTNQAKNEPKVTINMQLIDVFEDKLMKKTIVNTDNEVEDSLFNTNSNNRLHQNILNIADNKFNNEKVNNNGYHDTNTQKKYSFRNKNRIYDNMDHTTAHICTKNENNENAPVVSVFFNDSYQHSNFAQNNDELRDDSTNDSGFVKESVQAYSLAKSFLTEISASFKMIYKFIDESISEVRDEKLQEDKKKILLYKANKTQFHVAQVIEKLKCIIERESNDGTKLKSFLIKAGEASCDMRVSRYRQVVSKSLEQAQMLENALKLMLNHINDSNNQHHCPRKRIVII